MLIAALDQFCAGQVRFWLRDSFRLRLEQIGEKQPFVGQIAIPVLIAIHLLPQQIEVASVADAKAFRSGRDFSAWIGLVPKQNSSGGKDKLGSITKQGDRYLRSLFCAGALAVIRYAKIHGTKHRPWLSRLLERRPTKVAAIALANKIARMAWAMMAKGECYREPVALAR